MPSRQSIRLRWEDGEPLEEFQSRMEQICSKRKGTLPYEQKRFEEGWMYVEWTTYKPDWNSSFRPESELANTIYDTLKDEDGKFVFDDNKWKPKELVPSVMEVCKQLNARMQSFLGTYQGKDLILDRMADREDDKPDWYANSGDVSWFLKRPT